ncbi:hypothetical protein BN961_01197 [Afipia felis]|jgi:hypothetical protein|uniref:Uncharacterized protein n=1 Tax=Afipia felis TaxID=1035 RepID=A0A090MQ72_AFIFE|nr:hypothetical protein BN961_01197 [Afipia felis]
MKQPILKTDRDRVGVLLTLILLVACSLNLIVFCTRL